MKALNLKSALLIAIVSLSIACKRENPVKDHTVSTAKEFTSRFGAQKQIREINER